MKEDQKPKQKSKKKFNKNMIHKLKNKNNHINKILINIMIKNKEDIMTEEAMMMQVEIIGIKKIKIKSNNMYKKIQIEEMKKVITTKVDHTETEKESKEEAIIIINRMQIEITKKMKKQLQEKKITEKKLKRKKLLESVKKS